MLRRCFALFSVSLIAVLLLAACGDDPTPTPASPAGQTGTPAAQGGDTIHVEMLDTMRYNPDTITVSAGQEVTIDLENVGVIPHTFTVDEAGVDVELAGRERETFTFTAPAEPGEYEIYCDIPGHKQAGMVATLVVE
jgi:plastocyanin